MPGPSGEAAGWLASDYLPDCLPGEVEIARLRLPSAARDVVSVRARRRGRDGRILYRVTDEYDTAFTFEPRSSRRPLTWGQLAALLDSIDTPREADPAGRRWLARALDARRPGWHGDGGGLRVESRFYPGLAAGGELMEEALAGGEA